MPTAAGVSPGVPTSNVVMSLVVFTLLYGALAVIEVGLLVRQIRIGPPESVPDPFLDAKGREAAADRPLTFSY
jgi:cytochrome d ubiquinol oxidase subunit I